MSIAENITKLKKELTANVTLVVAVKYASPAQIKEAVEAGVLDLGFNTYKQMRDTKPMLPSDVRLHFIGHLQKNKVKNVLECNVALMQSVDSCELAEKIDAVAEKLGIKQDILLEVKTDKSKEYGFNPDDVEDALKKITVLHNINLRGLITIPPITNNAEESKKYFAAMKELYEKCAGYFKKPSYLSMGMSDDYRIAVGSGANMVRIGRAVFC